MSWSERIVVAVAMMFGLAAAVRFLVTASPEPHILNYLLLLCNGPGFLVAAIPFWLMGGFRTAHGGEAIIPAIAILLIGNPLGFGILAYLLVSRVHRGNANKIG